MFNWKFHQREHNFCSCNSSFQWFSNGWELLHYHNIKKSKIPWIFGLFTFYLCDWLTVKCLLYLLLRSMVCWQSVAINVSRELLHLILELDELKPETSWWGTTWRCFCLWHSSMQGAGSVSLQGKPVPHNFTPNLNFKVTLHYYTDSSIPGLPYFSIFPLFVFTK